MEAGIVLHGTEVKSLRARRANLEFYVYNFHLAPYEQAGHAGTDIWRSWDHEPAGPTRWWTMTHA